jgi:hypothetical protein
MNRETSHDCPTSSRARASWTPVEEAVTTSPRTDARSIGLVPPVLDELALLPFDEASAAVLAYLTESTPLRFWAVTRRVGDRQVLAELPHPPAGAGRPDLQGATSSALSYLD